MTEFVALRAKSYAYSVERQTKIKAKGIRGNVVKNHMSLEDRTKCMFGNNSLFTHTENVSRRSFNHQLRTIKASKLIIYNCRDDKRFILRDGVHTIAHSHYRIK